MKNIYVLILEDDRDIAKYIKKDIDRLACKTKVVYTSEKFLDEIKTKKPDIMIVDIMMDKPTGIDAGSTALTTLKT